ncbi:MAG: very short patch repair endonuclease [Coriobacteriia bacterium]
MAGRRDRATTSRMMAAIKRADTKPELALRRALHGRGVRYRLQAGDVFGHPDLVVRRLKVAVFVDGDMWHGNEHVRRGLPDLEALFPTNTQFWCEKIRRNVERDRQVSEHLTADGWTVVRLWATDVLADPDSAAQVVEDAITRSRRARDERRGNCSGSDGEVL